LKFVFESNIDGYVPPKIEDDKNLATKKAISIKEESDVLVFFLNRVIYDPLKNTCVKIHTRLDFPINITLDQYMDGKKSKEFEEKEILVQSKFKERQIFEKRLEKLDRILAEADEIFSESLNEMNVLNQDIREISLRAQEAKKETEIRIKD